MFFDKCCYMYRRVCIWLYYVVFFAMFCQVGSIYVVFIMEVVCLFTNLGDKKCNPFSLLNALCSFF